MYRLLVDRLTRSYDPQLGSYTVASLGYRVYPDADTPTQVRLGVAVARPFVSVTQVQIRYCTFGFCHRPFRIAAYFGSECYRVPALVFLLTTMLESEEVINTYDQALYFFYL